ncbi:MAG TPA: alpha/beta hydrolase [Streptosporangiaceae bacterium]
MPVIRVHGTDLHYADTGGSGEPVLFLHGFLFDGRQFDAQVAALRDQYRCLTLDFRGQGRSASSPGGYQTEQLTADVLAVIRALGIAPVHLAGLSMGGFAAMRIAAREPAVVRSLILLNTSAAAHPRAKVPGHLALTAVGRLAGLSGRLLTSRIEAEMYGAAFRGDPGRAGQREIWSQRWARADRAAVAKTMLGIVLRPDIRAELGDIRAPTLIIAGAADTSLPPRFSREMQSLIAGSQLVELPGAGHSSPVEDPDGVTRALREFLAARSGPPGQISP